MESRGWKKVSCPPQKRRKIDRSFNDVFGKIEEHERRHSTYPRGGLGAAFQAAGGFLISNGDCDVTLRRTDSVVTLIGDGWVAGSVCERKAVVISAFGNRLMSFSSPKFAGGSFVCADEVHEQAASRPTMPSIERGGLG